MRGETAQKPTRLTYHIVSSCIRRSRMGYPAGAVVARDNERGTAWSACSAGRFLTLRPGGREKREMKKPRRGRRQQQGWPLGLLKRLIGEALSPCAHSCAFYSTNTFECRVHNGPLRRRRGGTWGASPRSTLCGISSGQWLLIIPSLLGPEEVGQRCIQGLVDLNRPGLLRVYLLD